jgi:8-oxo-dGTP pyrophosphatase MutT (NUDIX family)
MAIHKTQRARVIIKNNDKILLTLAMIGDQKWELPGGGATKQEDIISTGLREVKEETGISLTGANIREIHRQELKRKGANFTSHFLLCELDELVDIKKEWPWILEAKWFDLAELPDNMQPSDRAAIDKLR